MERYFFAFVDDVIACDDNGHIKSFATEQEAAEYVWDAIKAGNRVHTLCNFNFQLTNWTYGPATDGIVGEVRRQD